MEKSQPHKNLGIERVAEEDAGTLAFLAQLPLPGPSLSLHREARRLKVRPRAGGRGLAVKCSLQKHEDLSLIPRMHVKQLGLQINTL